MLPDLPWFVYAMLLAPLGLLLVAAVYKSLQVRAAREWPSAAGKVVVSNAEVRKVKVIDSDREEGHRFEERNFANIVYEYSVAGRKLRNNRVSIGEDLGNFEVAETIAQISGRHGRHRLLQPAASGRGGAGARPAEGHVGLPRHRHGDRAGDRVRFGDRPASDHRIRLDADFRITETVAAAVAFGAFGIAGGAVRARPAPAGIAGEEMAGRNGHHQAVGHRAVPCRADRTDHRAGRSCTSARCPTPTSTTIFPTPIRTPRLASSVASTSSWLVRKSTTDYQDGATVKV